MTLASKNLSSLPATADNGSRCHVAVLYENTSARERAVWLSHDLVEKFWTDIDFDFSWWRFRYLGDPTIAEQAAEAACEADILIFSAGADSQVPSELRIWLDRWLHHLGDNSPVLVPLVDPATVETLSNSPLVALLQDAAGNLGLECLLPTQLRDSFLPPQLRDSYLFSEPMVGLQNRARQVTQVLDDILNTLGRPPTPPPHWGINE